MPYFHLKRLFLSLVLGAIRHSCQSSYTEAWLILYVGRLPVKKLTDKNKPATPAPPPPPPPPPHSFRTSQSECRDESHDSTRLSFLITNEGVFSKWIGVGGIGVSFEGFTSPMCTCCLFVLWCMLVCLGEKGRGEKKFDCLPLYVTALFLSFIFTVKHSGMELKV